MYLPKHGKWPSQHLYLKINSGFHARKNPKQQYLKVVTFSDASFRKKHIYVSQPAIICSKLTTETLEQDVIDVVLVSLLLTLNIFHTFILVAISIFNYEQANAVYVYDHSV